MTVISCRSLSYYVRSMIWPWQCESPIMLRLALIQIELTKSIRTIIFYPFLFSLIFFTKRNFTYTFLQNVRSYSLIIAVQYVYRSNCCCSSFFIIASDEKKKQIVQCKYCTKASFAKYISKQQNYLEKCYSYLQYQKDIQKENAIACQPERDKI